MIYCHTAGDHRTGAGKPVGLDRYFKLLEKFFTLLIVTAGQYHDELIAADPEYGAVFEDFADQAARALENLIAVTVTSGIVHPLKVIQIAHDYPEGLELFAGSYLVFH